jgi:hypothetical protein
MEACASAHYRARKLTAMGHTINLMILQFVKPYVKTNKNDGRMKSDGKLDRNWLEAALGDAVHVVLCGAGHNLRLIINQLKAACQPEPVY